MRASRLGRHSLLLALLCAYGVLADERKNTGQCLFAMTERTIELCGGRFAIAEDQCLDVGSSEEPENWQLRRAMHVVKVWLHTRLCFLCILTV